MQPAFRSRAKGGFTLIEILVAAAVTIILVGILLKITTLTSVTVNTATQRLSDFASARTAFDVMTRNLSQATLNTYLDYYGNTSNSTNDASMRRVQNNTSAFYPVAYGRASDLQFLIRQNVQNGTGNHGQEVYFQAPRSYSIDPALQSAQGLLNACGYYIQFGSSSLFAPSPFQAAGNVRYRYRLMQGMEPTDDLQIYSATGLSSTGSTTDSSSKWLGNIQNGAGNGSEFIAPLADNIIALIVWPRLAANDQAAEGSGVTLTTDFTYDSQNASAVTPQKDAAGTWTQGITGDQLPPDVQVTMIALDEASALRLQGTATTMPGPIESALAGRFVTATQAQYKADMGAVATALSALHVNFEFFNTTVAMRESKWSTPQSDN